MSISSSGDCIPTSTSTQASASERSVYRPRCTHPRLRRARSPAGSPAAGSKGSVASTARGLRPTLCQALVRLPRFTVLFAVARATGWVSQWRESICDSNGMPPRISRPRQMYMGEVLRDFVPLAKRPPVKARSCAAGRRRAAEAQPRRARSTHSSIREETATNPARGRCPALQSPTPQPPPTSCPRCRRCPLPPRSSRLSMGAALRRRRHKF